eukprot:gene14036-18824_t
MLIWLVLTYLNFCACRRVVPQEKRVLTNDTSTYLNYQKVWHDYIDSYDDEIKENIYRRLLETFTVDDHKVRSLPGISDSLINFNHYAGHILVDPVKNGQLFYWLFEAPSKSEDLPLLIWVSRAYNISLP